MRRVLCAWLVAVRCAVCGDRMAPEVLLSDEYNELADVWSLGITAYELAVGEPPHAKLHSMRAAVKIPQSTPPTLPDPETWSGDFHSFIGPTPHPCMTHTTSTRLLCMADSILLRAMCGILTGNCLVKDPSRRPSAEALLLHPFIARAAEPTVLQPMVAQRERDASNTQRKAHNVGSGDSLDSLDEDSTAPLTKPPPPQQHTQPQAQPQPRTQAPAQPSYKQQASGAQSGRPAVSKAGDRQRDGMRGDASVDRSREQRASADLAQQQQPPQHSQLKQLDDNHTRTLPTHY